MNNNNNDIDNNIIINNNCQYIYIYAKRLIDYLYEKYKLKKINFYYSEEYEGYFILIEKTKTFYLYINKKDFNMFIINERVRDVNLGERANKCGLNNTLYKNIYMLIPYIYYFKNKDDIKLLNTSYKYQFKINDIYIFNNIFI